MHSYLEFATKEQLDDIYAEFGTNEESLQNDARYLKEWMEKQPHLPNITDEEFLMNFLLRCKNSLERTKQQLDIYYTHRAVAADIFLNRHPQSENFLKLSEVLTLVPLPKLTTSGQRVWIFKITENIKKYQPKPETLMEAVTMIVDISIKNDRVKSCILIFDLENITMAFGAIIFAVLKKLVEFSTKVAPFRIDKIYVLNLTPAFEPIVTFGKNLVKHKLAQRIEIWKKKPTDLIEVIPKDILTTEYGGHEKNTNELKELGLKYMNDFIDWIEKEKTMMTDLQKIPDSNELNTNFTEYGMEGSFRKITID